MRGWPWTVASLGVAAICFIPLAGLISGGVGEVSPGLSHFYRYIAPLALSETLLLVISVIVITTVTGATLAWLTTAFKFPGVDLFSWCLTLPLAVPPYIAAYTLADLFDPGGEIWHIGRWVSSVIGLEDPLRPDLRNIGGGIAIFSAVLFPYPYIASRAYLQQQSTRVIEQARLLGLTPHAIFWRIVLPGCRTPIVLGGAFVLFETLNDVGVAEYLGIKTLTLGIFTTWLHQGDLRTASQLALQLGGLLCLVYFFVRRFHPAEGRRSIPGSRRSFARINLAGWQAPLACIACAFPVVAGLGLPATMLVREILVSTSLAAWAELLQASLNSLGLGLLVTLIVVTAALIVSHAQVTTIGTIRRVNHAIAGIAPLGYSIAGPILAIGMLPAAGFLHHGLGYVMVEGLGLAADGAWLTVSSLVILVVTIFVRLLAVGIGPIGDAYFRNATDAIQAASLLGLRHSRSLTTIAIPLITPTLLAAALLVFVETVKELSILLILRPFGFETLATQLYTHAANESWDSGASAALLIVAVGALPLYCMKRYAWLQDR